MGYCGCATKAAKLRWGIVVVGILLGIALLIGVVKEFSSCRICYADGTCEEEWKGFSYKFENGKEWVEDEQGNVYEGAHMSCSMGLSLALYLLAHVCFIAAAIPCCYNCCCAKRPGENPSFQMQQYAPMAPYQGPPAANGYIAAVAPPQAAAAPMHVMQHAEQHSTQHAPQHPPHQLFAPQVTGQALPVSPDQKAPLL